MTNTQKIIRWLLFIPGAVIISILVYLFIYYSQVAFIDFHGIYNRYILPFYATVISGVVFMLAVSEIVPSYRLVFVTIMYVIMGGLAITGIVLYYHKEEYSKLALAIGNIIGLTLGYLGGKEMAEKGERLFDK